MSAQTSENYGKYACFILVLILELLHNEYHQRYKYKYQLRYQRFKHGIDAQYIKCIVERYQCLKPLGRSHVYDIALDEFLDARAQERDRHYEHQYARTQEERSDGQLYTEETYRQEYEYQHHAACSESAPYIAHALCIRKQRLIEQYYLRTLTEHRKERCECQCEHAACFSRHLHLIVYVLVPCIRFRLGYHPVAHIEQHQHRRQCGNALDYFLICCIRQFQQTQQPCTQEACAYR